MPFGKYPDIADIATSANSQSAGGGITQLDRFQTNYDDGSSQPDGVFAPLREKLKAMNINDDAGFNDLMTKVKADLAGKPKGTKDSITGGLFSVPDPSRLERYAGPIIQGLALGGTLFGVGGGSFGPTPGGTGPIAVGGGTGAVASGGAGALAPLADPSGVANFLSTVPEAVPGTQLPVGGSLVDITAPGAVGAAGASGNLITPAGGTAPTAGAASAPAADPNAPVSPDEIPGTPGAAVPGPEAAAPVPQAAPAQAPVAPAPAATPAPATPTGAPIGGAEVVDKSTLATEADKARLAPKVKPNVIQMLTNNPLTAAGLGINLAAQVNARSQGRSAARELRESGRAAREASERLLNQTQPTAASEFEISKWENDNIAALQQRYASMGRDPVKDSAAAREIADIKAKGVALRSQAVQGLTEQGLRAAQIAQGPSTNAAILGQQQDVQAAQAMQELLRALGQIQSMQTPRTQSTI